MNVVALFIAPLIIVTAEAFANTQMPYLLADPNYYNQPVDKVASIVSRAFFWGSLSATIIVPFMGYAYEICGRYWLIVPGVFLTVIIFFLYPLVAPSLAALYAFRSIFSVLAGIVMHNPLVADYIRSESRGHGMGIIGYGSIFGHILMVILFEFSRGMSRSVQFLMAALVLIILAVYLAFIVREPKIMEKKTLENG